MNISKIEQLPETGYLYMFDKEIPNVTNIIDKLLFQDNARREKTSHYPSGARIATNEGVVGACARQQYYTWAGEIEESSEEVEEDISGLWKMDMGNAIHEWIGKKLSKRFQVLSEYTVVYHPEFLKKPIRGRIDNLVISEEFGNFGVEIKSGYGKGITNRQGGVKYNGPKDSHLMQALIYLCISRLPDEEKEKYMPVDETLGRPISLPPLDFFVIYYIARDSAYRLSFYLDLMESEKVIERFGHILGENRTESLKTKKYVPVVSDGTSLYVLDDISFRGIVESFITIEQSVESKKLPNRDFNLQFFVENGEMIVDRKGSDWQCSYCRFKKICYLRDSEL
jgi:hypothetical protein